MARPCLFCGKSGIALSNEHITPRWLLEHLGLPDDDQLFQGVASTATGALTQPPRIMSSFNHVHGHVCKVDCNEGWMSRLEAAAKPALVDLIDGRRAVSTVSPREARIIGKWAAKTAYLHSCSSPLQQPVAAVHLKALDTDAGTPLDGVCVFAMQGPFRTLKSHVQVGYWPQLAGVTALPNGAPPDDAFKLGLQYGHLYLLVSYWPGGATTFVLERDVHVPLYPPEITAWASYAFAVPWSDNETGRLLSFCRTLGIFHVQDRM